MGKKKGSKIEYASGELVSAWLRMKDKRLFMDRTWVLHAKHLCQEDLGKRVRPALFRECRAEVCRFWKKIPRRKFSGRTHLNWREWDRFRQWLLDPDNRSLVMEKDSTVDFIAAVMRGQGVSPCSPELLVNSCSFMEVWKRRRFERFEGK